MKLKKGLRLKDKNTGHIITLKRKASGNGHWACACGNKNHKVHEGTLKRFYEPVENKT